MRTLEPDRAERVPGKAAAADRSGVVARVHDDVIGQLEQLLERRVEEAGLAERVAGDVKVGSPHVTDQERVAGEDKPGLVGAATAVGDDEARCAPVRGPASRAPS